MKKIVTVVMVYLLLLLTSCDKKNELMSSSENSIDFFSSDLNYSLETMNNDLQSGFNIVEKVENFIYRRNFYKVDDWIYYMIDHDLRKCKPDLTENILLEQDIYDFYIQNSVMYFVKSPNNKNEEMYIAKLGNMNFYAEKIAELKESHNWIILLPQLNLAKLVEQYFI